MCEKRIFITVAVERQLFPSQSVPKVAGLFVRWLHFKVILQSAAVGSTYAGDTGDRCSVKHYHYFYVILSFFSDDFEFIHQVKGRKAFWD